MLIFGVRTGWEHIFVNGIYEEQYLAFNTFKSAVQVTDTNNCLRVR